MSAYTKHVPVLVSLNVHRGDDVRHDDDDPHNGGELCVPLHLHSMSDCQNRRWISLRLSVV